MLVAVRTELRRRGLRWRFLELGRSQATQEEAVMQVDLAPAVETRLEVRAAEIVFATLPSLGMDRMTAGGVEFVICASALTANV